MKKVIVTDPCYLISNEDWDKIISECEEIKGEDWYDIFSEYVEAFMREKFDDKLVVADSTGFGDWTNEIDGVEFGADSGMVCVVEYTEELKDYLKKNSMNIPLMCAAILPVENDATYEINRSDKSWSVVRIKSGDMIIESCK